MLASNLALQRPTGCAGCPALELNLCQAIREISRAAPSTPVQQSTSRVPARRIISNEELAETFPIICEGWAASFILLPNGSRQILSLLLPGDVLSVALLFGTRPYFQVEAVTTVRYCTFDRNEFRKALLDAPDVFDRFGRIWVEERAMADQLIVDLGRRTALERIARLILNLESRLKQRGMIHAQTKEMDFPLRQHHIADATGLTPVHVSKMLAEFRRRGLIELNERSLTVRDPEGLRRSANLR
jgi:CRP/FNR family transcriptional regulator